MNRSAKSAVLSLVALSGAANACGSGSQTLGDAGVPDVGTIDDSSADRGLGQDAAAASDASADPDGPTSDLVRPEVEPDPRPTPLKWVKERSGVISRTIGGTGPNDVWVVGDAGRALHSQGDGTWTSRNADTAGRITGVWGTAPNNVYASVMINIVLHWNGTAWEKQTDGIPIGATYKAIWGSGPNDIYIAGALYHSTGDGRWESIPLPSALGPILSIWGSGPNDVWALGGASIARKKGDGVWTLEQTGRPNGNQAMWGSGPSDIYVVHGDDVLHTTGNGIWTQQIVDNGPLEGLTCIWGSGPNDIYVGGVGGALFHSIGNGKWHRESLDSANPMASVEGIWGTSTNNVYIFAGNGIYHGT